MATWWARKVKGKERDTCLMSKITHIYSCILWGVLWAIIICIFLYIVCAGNFIKAYQSEKQHTKQYNIKCYDLLNRSNLQQCRLYIEFECYSNIKQSNGVCTPKHPTPSSKHSEINQWLPLYPIACIFLIQVKTSFKHVRKSTRHPNYIADQLFTSFTGFAHCELLQTTLRSTKRVGYWNLSSSNILLLYQFTTITLWHIKKVVIVLLPKGFLYGFLYVFYVEK